MIDESIGKLYAVVRMVHCSGTPADVLRDLADEQDAAAWAGPPALGVLCACGAGRESLLLLAWRERESRDAWLAAPRAVTEQLQDTSDACRTYVGSLDTRDADALDADALNGSEIGVERCRLVAPDPRQLAALGHALLGVAPSGTRLGTIPDSQGVELLALTRWSDQRGWLDHLAGAARARALAPFATDLASIHASLLSVRPVTRPAAMHARERALACRIDVLDDSPQRDLRPALAALAECIPVLGLKAGPDPVFFLAREADVRAVLADCDTEAPWRLAPGACELTAPLRAMLAAPPPDSLVHDAAEITVAALDACPRAQRIELGGALLRPVSHAVSARAAQRLSARVARQDAAVERAWHGTVDIAARTLEAALGQALLLPGLTSPRHLDAAGLAQIAAAITPVRWTMRRLSDDRVIDGYRLRAGTLVLLNLAPGPTGDPVAALPLWIEDLPPAFRLFELVLPVIHQTLAAREITPLRDVPRRFVRDTRFDAYATLAARVTPSRDRRDARSGPHHIPTEMRP